MNDLEVFPPARQWPDLPPQPPKAQQRQLSSPRPAILFTFFQLFRGSLIYGHFMPLHSSRILCDLVLARLDFFLYSVFSGRPNWPSKLLTCILYIYTVSTYRRCIIYTYICYFSRTVLNVVFGNHLQFLCDYLASPDMILPEHRIYDRRFDRFMVAFDAWEPAGSSKNMNMEAVMLLVCHSETNDALSTSLERKGRIVRLLLPFGDSFAIWLICIDSRTSKHLLKLTGNLRRYRLFLPPCLQVNQMVYSPSGDSLWVATGGNPGSWVELWTPVLNSTDSILMTTCGFFFYQFPSVVVPSDMT